MNPYTILTLVTAGLSIYGFNNRSVISALILHPYTAVRHREWYRIVTHAFIHADWMHLIFNMVALWSFGAAIFEAMGRMTLIPSVHFFVMYFGAILFSSISDLVKHRKDQSYATLGASGAVSAVIFFSILINPWSMILIFFIPCPGIIFGALYLVYSQWMSRKSVGKINHDAHFYGALFGLLYPLFIQPKIYTSFIHLLLHPTFL
jgi:membrane associated rhomboid family serine protease